MGLHPLARPLEPVLPQAVPVDALLPVHAHGAEVRHVFPPLTGSGSDCGSRRGIFRQCLDEVKRKPDLLIRGKAVAKANRRDIIEPFDLPITKGLQERIHEFKDIDEEIELKPILDSVWRSPAPSRSSILISRTPRRCTGSAH